MRKLGLKIMSLVLSGIFFLSMVLPVGMPSASASEINQDDITAVKQLISKFKKLSPQQVTDALAIGQTIIDECNTNPEVLSPEQKLELKSLGLTKEQVEVVYGYVVEQLNTKEKIEDLQDGSDLDWVFFANNVADKFDQDLIDTLKEKGISKEKVISTTLKVAALTFDPFENIPKEDLKKILNDDMGIASDTAARYGLTWTHVEALRDSLSDEEKADLISILNTITSTPGGGGGGGGGSVTPSPVNSTTGSANVNPSAGGTISLGSEAAVAIPAGALQGASNVEINIEKVTAPPEVPAGFKVLGTVFEFKVGGKSTYNFDKPVTLTFSFDPAALGAGEVPAIHYYDEAQAKWVNLGGVVSGKTITITVEHFTKFAVMGVQVSLTDVTGHWAEDSIKQLVAKGAITGYPDNSFKPNNRITRAEFATVLVKAFSLAPQSGKLFADTNAHWAKDAIATAASYGIIKGYDDAAFGPDDLITREQMAVMIVRAAKLDTASAGITFGDAASVSAWATDAVSTAVNKGIMKGYPDNTFKPLANATRAEAVTVISNALK